MISKALIKDIKALQQPKFRQIYNKFIAEGEKVCTEFLISSKYMIEKIFVSNIAFAKYQNILEDKTAEIILVSHKEMEQISSFKTSSDILLLLERKEDDDNILLKEGTSAIYLDGIQDPGNVGTIIRIADWFGMKSVICTEGTADVLNAKTLRGSMGSVFRIKITYVKSLFPQIADTPCPILLADMQGESLEKAVLSGKEWILLGNEANGVNPEIAALSSLKKIHISGKGQAESLNVAVSAGIFAYRVANP